MENRPQTLNEWWDYVQGLSGDVLYSQAQAANTHGFARLLLSEGLVMADVAQVMLMFVRQLRATGTKVPGGGAWDLLSLAQTDPVARKGPRMSEEEAQVLEHSIEPPSSDDFDQFEKNAEISR